MAHPYDGPSRGMRRAVTGSLIIHALVLAALLTIGWSGQRSIMQDPVFVDIVSTGRKASEPAGKAIPPKPPDDASADKGKAVKKTDQKAEADNARQKAAVKIPAKQTSKAEPKAAKRPDDADVVLRRDAAKKEKERASVEEALKRVAEKVRKKDDASAIESRIAEIRRKDEAEQGAIKKRLADVKKTLAQRPPASGITTARETGSGRSAAIEAKYPAYYSIIKDRVQAAWIYPEGFNANDVSIVISIKIGKSGRLIDSWVEKSSGNKNFDDSLINAVKKASPFPPLPQDFKNVYLETGLRFCPLCKE
ncbi:MAG: cell envelope integrity protein TolA [Deltaproteobacteria bacterium]